MVFDNQGNYENQAAAIKAIAPKIGCGRDSLRRWDQQEETDTGRRAGVTSEERELVRDEVSVTVQRVSDWLTEHPTA